MKKRLSATLAGAAWLFAADAFAADVLDPNATFGGLQGLAAEEMAESRARGLNDASVTTGDVIAGITGTNNVELRNFGGQGIFNFVQNSGNASAVQAATNVTVNIH